jgi:hypothetical protein
MDAAGDPDPDSSVRPTVFYGLWPRFVGEDLEGADDPVAAEATAGLAE